MDSERPPGAREAVSTSIGLNVRQTPLGGLPHPPAQEIS